MTHGSSFARDYLQWLTDNIREHPLENGWTEISTPFLDHFNDGIVIYAYNEGNAIILSDDGIVANNTIAIGEPPSKKKMEAFRHFLKPYGVTVADDGEMQMNTSQDKYPIHFHLFLQAVMSANDMFSPRSRGENTAHIFKDEIMRFFDASDVAYSSNVKLEGLSGIIHEVGFILPKRKQHPERLIYALNKPSRQNVELTLFNWSDIQKKRGTNSNMIAFLNDAEQNLPSSIFKAFKSYEALPIPWSKRDIYKDRLAV